MYVLKINNHISYSQLPPLQYLLLLITERKGVPSQWKSQADATSTEFSKCAPLVMGHSEPDQMQQEDPALHLTGLERSIT